MTVPAIPTHYAGTDFRSRLEARWAALFDILGWHWVYEPIDGAHYIPDFLLTGGRPLYVEVGPCATPSEYADKARRAEASASTLRRDLLVVGLEPTPVLLGKAWTESAIGWLGEIIAEPMVEPFDSADGWTYEWEAGLWVTCRECQQPAVYHPIQSYAARPCGHYDGDHHLGQYRGPDLERAWRVAGNRVRWKPRS